LGLEPQTLLVSCACAIALSSEICRAQSLRIAIGGAVCTVARRRRDALGKDNRVGQAGCSSQEGTAPGPET
jgi:hypothetical protein